MLVIICISLLRNVHNAFGLVRQECDTQAALFKVAASASAVRRQEVSVYSYWSNRHDHTIHNIASCLQARKLFICLLLGLAVKISVLKERFPKTHGTPENHWLHNLVCCNPVSQTLHPSFSNWRSGSSGTTTKMMASCSNCTRSIICNPDMPPIVLTASENHPKSRDASLISAFTEEPRMLPRPQLVMPDL